MTLPDPMADLLELKPIELLVTPDNAQMIAYIAKKDLSQIAQRLLSAAEAGVACTVSVKSTEDEIRYLKNRYIKAKNDIEKAKKKKLIGGLVSSNATVKEQDAHQSDT